MMCDSSKEVARGHKELREGCVRRRTAAAKANRKEEHEHADQVIGHPTLRRVVHAAPG